MSQGITKKALEDCVANTTEEPGLKSIFPANAEAKCCGPPLRAKPDCVEHYETIVGRSLRSKGAQKKARERKRGAVFAILRLESHSRLWELLGRMFAIVSIVIVIIPVALGAPTVTVFIPPAMVAGVAVLADFRGVDGEPCRPDGCCGHGLQWLHEDDDRPGKCASGNCRRRANSERRRRAEIPPVPHRPA